MLQVQAGQFPVQPKQSISLFPEVTLSMLWLHNNSMLLATGPQADCCVSGSTAHVITWTHPLTRKVRWQLHTASRLPDPATNVFCHHRADSRSDRATGVVEILGWLTRHGPCCGAAYYTHPQAKQTTEYMFPTCHSGKTSSIRIHLRLLA